MSEFNATSTPVARKQYRCEWCLGPIPKGEKHKHYVGKFDGDFQNWRMHNECYESADLNDSFDDGFCAGDGEMPERVRILMKERG